MEKKFAIVVAVTILLFVLTVLPTHASPPVSGEWNTSTEFGELEFTVNNSGTGISKISFNFSDWTCGPITRTGRVSESRTPDWPISSGQFIIETDLGRLMDYSLPMTISGKFDEIGTAASGTWEAVSSGVTYSGTWSARRVQTTGDIDINEIMYNPPGADTDNEWLELYNNDTTDIDIKGWRFYEAGINHSLTLTQGSRIIPAGGYAIIADNATTFLDEYQECNCTVLDSAFSLNNSGEYIALKNATLGIIDEVAYNASWGADGNGRTLELNATGRWEESRVDEGTPCQQNSVLAVDYSGE